MDADACLLAGRTEFIAAAGWTTRASEERARAAVDVPAALQAHTELHREMAGNLSPMSDALATA